MAIVNLFKNQISNEVVTKEIDGGAKVSELSSILDLPTREIYNQRTKKTRFEQFNFKDCTIIVNDKEETLDYEIKQDDIVSIYPRQYNGDQAMTNLFTGIGAVVLGAIVGIGAVVTGGLLAPIGGVILFGSSVLGGLAISEGIDEIRNRNKAKTYDSGENSESSLTLRGGANESIIGQRFPFVFGRHLVSPRIVGSPYTEISSKNGIGDVVTQRQLMVVGYSPLKVTDIKFEENIVAYNKDTSLNGETINRKTIFHGKLSGVGTTQEDGDIVRKWKNNDIEIEILQDFSSENDTDVYGTIYPQTVVQKEVNSPCLHIYDKDIENEAKVVYKAKEFEGGFRNNTVRFSQGCPSRLEVELDFSQGLYGTDTYSDESKSEVRYYNIPCNVAVQWRFVQKDQQASTADDPTGWTSFTQGSDCSLVSYTSKMAADDISRNKGLTNGTSTKYNEKWIGSKCFLLGSYDNTSYKSGTVNINERRYVFSYDFSTEEAKKLCDLNKEGYLDVVEVRVVRLTPMYLDETGSVSSDSNFSNRSYQDLFNWTLLRSFCFDKEAFVKNPEIESLTEIPLRPLSKADMRKFCLLSIKASPDAAGTIANAFKKINVVATSLGPKLVNGDFVPSIEAKFDYFVKEKLDNDWVSRQITEEEYKEKIENGEKAFKVKSGNDFLEKIKKEIFVNENNFVKDFNGYYLTKDIEDKFVSSNVASTFLLSLVGGHLGVDAKDYSSCNMLSIKRLYEFCEDVTDGSVDENSQDGLKHIKYCCDGVLGSDKKLGTFLSNVLLTGRSVLTFDDSGRFKVVIDEPRKYPEMVLSQQNTISSSNTKVLEDAPSGYEIPFVDAADNFDTNTIFVMADGEDHRNPKKEIVPYSLNYVVNKDHVWSLGRYVLASNILQREIYTRTVGKVGRLLRYGSYVLLRDETLLLGSDKGGRIEKLLEDDENIYGFVIDDVYEYTGELEGSVCKKGLILVQPHQFGMSRCVTLRLCTPDGITKKDGTILTPTKGLTNVVILEKPIAKEKSVLIDGIWVNICPKEGNLVEFGTVGEITKHALVTSVKPSSDGTHTVSLCQYSPETYKYGKELPVLQKTQKIIDTSVGELDFVEYQNKTQSQIATSEKINSALAQLGEKQKPSAPKITKIAPEEKGIKLCVSLPNGKGNTIQSVLWEVNKGDGFIDFFEASSKDDVYLFQDEFLEESELSKWMFRARILNSYNVLSDYSEIEFATFENYGTWKIQKPVILPQVLDRSTFLTLSLSSRSDNKPVYGNIRYKIVIQRIGNKDIEGTEDYVEPDTDWFKPATSASWQTSEDNYKQGFAVTSYDEWLTCNSSFSQTLPLVGQTNKNSVATEYFYKVVAYNEAGYSVESDIISVTALPTNLADFVHSNENYKDLYVQRLSAISANVGLISQGGFGSFKKAKNYWAVSKLFPEDTGLEEIIEEGAFRVGGKDQYIWVEPIVENGRVIDYAVSVKAGNFIITSLGTQINGELIVQKSDVSDERTRITPSGTYFERKVGSGWQTINRFDISGVLSPSYKALQQILVGNFSQKQQRSLGHDIGRSYLSPDGKVWHFDEGYESNDGTMAGLTISGSYELKGAEQSKGIDYTPAIKAVAPYCQIAKCITGNFSIEKTLLDVKTATVDFWLQYLYAESQQLFSIGDGNDTIELNIQTDEPVFCVSGVCSWRNSSGEIIYTGERNPVVGKNVYYDKGFAEQQINQRGEVSEVIKDENFLVSSILFNGEFYVFESGDADLNYEVFAPESDWGEDSVLYNVATPGDIVLSHIGQTQREDVKLKELGKDLKNYSWYHLGVLFSNNDISFVFDDVVKTFGRYSTVNGDVRTVINNSKTSVIIDELYIDTTVEDIQSFIKNTFEKLPWGSLSRDDNWFIFDALDVSKVKSNILDALKEEIYTKVGLGLPNGSFVIQLPYGDLSPYEKYGGEWEDVSSQFSSAYLRVLGDLSASFGELQPEGLPNITGYINSSGGSSDQFLSDSEASSLSQNGALYVTSFKSTKSMGNGDSSYTLPKGIGFDANRSNKIYGASSHVTTSSHAIKIWKKIS